MPPRRRATTATSPTRTAILEAAEQVLLVDGHAGVTSRSVAAVAGIHAGNLHYYFPTIDDLFVALLERGADKSTARMAAALASPQPLRALWDLQANPRGVGLLDELMTAAKHRPKLREKVLALATTARRMQVEAFRELLPQYGLDDGVLPPQLLAAMLQGTSLLLVRQENMGLAAGQDSARSAAEDLIDLLETRRHLNKSSS